MPHYLLLRIDSKGFRKTGNQSYRAVLGRIGTVTFFRDRLNVSKLSARRIVRSRETQMKEFDQAVSEFGSTVFENNRRGSIRTVSLPRIKARERLEKDIIINLSEGGGVGAIYPVSSKVELVAKV